MLIYEWKEIYVLERQFCFVRMCINRLSIQQRQLVNELFVNRLTWDEYSDKYYLSRTELWRKRNRTLDVIVDLYNGILL